MECKFQKDYELQTKYVEFIDGYIKLDHVSTLLVTENQKIINYLPQCCDQRDFDFNQTSLVQ